jgi:hypothetical protein
MSEICLGGVVNATEDTGGDAAGGVANAAEDTGGDATGGVVPAAEDAGLRIGDFVHLARDQAAKSGLGKCMPAPDDQVV